MSTHRVPQGKIKGEFKVKYIHDEQTTNIHEKEGVCFITFPKLEAYNKHMLHGFSTRLGGVSKGYLGAMNLSFTRNDEREAVLKNHQLFAKALGYDEKNLVFSDQVHLTNIYKVSAKDKGKGIMKKSDIVEIDGLVTNEKNIPMITFYADCVPLFFYDPIEEVVAMAHAGWRGTVAGIGSKMVVYMQAEYGCQAKNIIVAIGPSICRKCYEVSKDVVDEFEQVFLKEDMNSMLEEKQNGKFQLDLQKANELILLKAGIQKKHLDITNLCTCCNSEVLFSHRASKGKRGNLAGVIMLRDFTI